jgi:hypothetical protein
VNHCAPNCGITNTPSPNRASIIDQKMLRMNKLSFLEQRIQEAKNNIDITDLADTETLDIDPQFRHVSNKLFCFVLTL